MLRPFVVKCAALLLLVLVSFNACSPKIISTSEVKDSTRTVFREHVNIVPVVVNIPEVKESIVTKDSVSYLENEFARSTAKTKMGLLYHSLETIPQEYNTSASVISTEVETSSTRTGNVVNTVIEYKEKKLNRWQRFRLDAFWPLVSFFILALALFVLKLIKRI